MRNSLTFVRRVDDLLNAPEPRERRERVGRPFLLGPVVRIFPAHALADVLHCRRHRHRRRRGRR